MLILAALALSQVQAQAAPPEAQRPCSPFAGQAPVTIAETPLLHDTRGRPVMNVSLNGSGPFRMVFDTAAQTSLISPALAGELALRPAQGSIDVTGATGTAQSRLYPVDRIGNALFQQRYVLLTELSNSNVTDARGIIGVESFSGCKLYFGRTAGTITVSPSAPAATGFAGITGHVTGEGLVEIPMALNDVAMPGLIDSGAAVTMVNRAGLRELGWTDDDPRLTDGGEIRGASALGQKIQMAKFDKVAIGRIVLSHVPVMIADDGSDQPSIILGSDLLNLFEGYAVDFGRGELQIELPKKPDTSSAP